MIQFGGKVPEQYGAGGYPTTLALKPPVLVLGRDCSEFTVTYRWDRINRKISSRNAITVREQDFDATRLLLCPGGRLAHIARTFGRCRAAGAGRP